MTVSDPLAQELPETSEALTVVLPVVARVASPGVDENVNTEVLLDDQVAELVTSEPFSLALNCTVVFVERLKGPGGLIVRVCVLDPVTLPVADPVTPPCVALMVTLDVLPTPLTSPALTVAQGLELSQVADFVMSFDPLLKVAVAKSCCVPPWVTENVVLPDPFGPVVTETEFG